MPMYSCMSAPANKNLLYTIFEHHLFQFQDPNSDKREFILTIVKDYLTQLRKLGLGVPKELEEAIFEELYFQVNSMLLKKIYGCSTIDEYIAKTPTRTKKVNRKKAYSNYRALNNQISKKSA
jgi:hypothetical protein